MIINISLFVAMGDFTEEVNCSFAVLAMCFPFSATQIRCFITSLSFHTKSILLLFLASNQGDLRLNVIIYRLR